MANIMVVDASADLTWIFEDEQSPMTDTLIDLMKNSDCTVTVPSLWFLEVGNAILAAERRARLSRSDGERALMLLSSLPLTIHPMHSGQWSFVIQLAREHELPTYDAAYLGLATQGGYPLATLDGRLRTAAKAIGLTVLPTTI